MTAVTNPAVHHTGDYWVAKREEAELLIAEIRDLRAEYDGLAAS